MTHAHPVQVGVGRARRVDAVLVHGLEQRRLALQLAAGLRDDLSLVGIDGVLDELDGQLEVVAAVNAAALELQKECGSSVKK